jgi:glutamine amidotransferase
MSAVTVLDFGMCNLLSVVRAFERCNARVRVAESPMQVAGTERLIVPGVGAFPDCATELCARGLDDTIREFALTGRPLLGICVGMQVLFDYSEEFGICKGLGLIRGAVKAIPRTDVAEKPHRIPHIGWSHLRVLRVQANSERSIFAGLAESPAMYFVHSYTAHPAEESDRLADAWYGGRRISAAVQRENIIGVQFHPEKSAQSGLRVVENFLAQ